MLETASFEEITALARQGDRRRVDLLVSDIYRSGKAPLAGDLNAASFGKLSTAQARPRREDLAHALMGLIGENVGLICSALAASAGVKRIVFAGTTLCDNEALVEILRALSLAAGHEAVFLKKGPFAGAFGALELAQP